MIKILDWKYNDDGTCTIHKAHIQDKAGYTWIYDDRQDKELDIIYNPESSRPKWSGYRVSSFEHALIELQNMGYLWD